jgi:hypothetical protein
MPNREMTWDDVWAAGRARQEELQWTDKQLQEACDISETTYRKGRQDGVPLTRPTKIARLESGLGWERGAVAAVLAGGHPVALDVRPGGVGNGGGVSRSDEGELRAELRDLRTLVERVLERLDLVDKRVDGLTTILEATEEQVAVLFEARESYAAGISTLPDRAPSSVRPLRPKSQPTSPPKQ